jgi:hypothetical protein
MLTPDYPQFVPAEPPPDGSTVSAWRGVLQPFENDAAARSILCDIEQERTLWVSAGSIRSSTSKEQHWTHPLLTGVDVAVDSSKKAGRCDLSQQSGLLPQGLPLFTDHPGLYQSQDAPPGNPSSPETIPRAAGPCPPGSHEPR